MINMKYFLNTLTSFKCVCDRLWECLAWGIFCELKRIKAWEVQFLSQKYGVTKLLVAGLVLTPGLQSQEGNRNPGLYSSKYGIWLMYNTHQTIIYCHQIYESVMQIRCKWYSWAETAAVRKIVLPCLSLPEKIKFDVPLISSTLELQIWGNLRASLRR